VRRAALVVCVALCAAPAPAFATLTPLPGSDFQGADGDQDDELPLVDWDALEAEGRVAHNEDSDTSDTTFAAGSKEGEPAHWSLDTTPGGVTPGKANILDAWSAVDQLPGRTFLYLSFARMAPTGATFLTFGSGTGPLTLVRRVRICRALLPRFIG
jgi:hypothetical protein